MQIDPEYLRQHENTVPAEAFLASAGSDSGPKCSEVL
jgi:hypothetical protein